MALHQVRIILSEKGLSTINIFWTFNVTKSMYTKAKWRYVGNKKNPKDEAAT